MMPKAICMVGHENWGKSETLYYQRSNLRRAKLRRAHMTSVNLRKCNLANAHCERIALHATDLRDIDLSAVRLPDARVFGSTISKRQVPQLLRALDVTVR